MKKRLILIGTGVFALVFAGLLMGVRFVMAHSPAASAPTTLDWLHYGNDLANTRYQSVDQINPGNVANLKVAWVFHTQVMDDMAELETSPIAVNGTLYVTDGHDDVFALNAATGDVKWSYKPLEMAGEMPSLDEIKICCGRNNRGVAFVPGETPESGKVIYGRLDDVAVALDANTGTVLWRTTIADYHNRLAINMAPQYADGLVMFGLSGGEYQVQGQVVALYAESGNVAWRFMTTEPKTWAGNSWTQGGAMAWQTPSVDEQLGLVYFGTGNAAPDINGHLRKGDNLYSSSTVALDLATGKVRWYFQETHHDLWDYDSTMTTVLFPAQKGEEDSVPALGHCSKNGNYYILNRRNGTPIFPVKEVEVPTQPAWQHASKTQPVSSVEPLTPLKFLPGTIDTTLLPSGVKLAPQWTAPTDQEYLMVPGDDGGCEGIAQGYSPRTKYVYYGTRYEPTTFKTFLNNQGPNAGGLFLGSTFDELTPKEGVTNFGLYGATDTTTGRVVWKIRIDQPAKSAVLIAGDLVFFGEGNGTFHAVDAGTGKMLFSFDGTTVKNGGGAMGAPVAYVVNGKEYIVNDFGGNFPDRKNFPPDPVGDAIVAFTLP